MRSRFIQVTAAVCLVGAFGLPAAEAQVIIQGVVNAPETPGGPRRESGAKLPQLVHADEEWASHLAKAEEFIKQGAYDRAIEILQALILLPDSGFVPLPDGQRFVSLWSKANDVVGRMDAKGLKFYRELYDPQAQRLCEEAAAAGDLEGLRQVVHNYLHTRYGAKALEMLGAIHFDHGRFSQAGRYWQQALDLKAPDSNRAMLLAKIVAARHLGGEEAAAARTLEALKKDHGGAEADLGGSRRNLVEFASQIVKLPVPAGGFRRVESDWPGLGGIPDGLAVMRDPSDVVLVPRWRQPEESVSAGSVEGKMVAAGNFFVGPGMRAVPRVRDGHVYVEMAANMGNRVTTRGYILPPMIHPVVVDRQVIFRTDDYVCACNLDTGRFLWKSVPLPMQRSVAANAGRVYYGGLGQATQFGDDGRYALTVGGGKVFALSDFRPMGNYNVRFFVGPMAPGGNDSAAADTSRLTALSVGGKVRWSLGAGRGDAEIVRNGKFVSAPAYRTGRLYVIAMYLESFHLICLDADSGSTVWTSLIAQVPASFQRYGGQFDFILHRASTPAVAEGRVFALTNAGVVAAFDAATGRGVWAYQYPSSVNQPESANVTPELTRSPANPVLILRDRLICLPSDGSSVLALSAETGAPAWNDPGVRRDGLDDLSAIDEDRILLSGPGLAVLSARNGSTLHRLADAGIVGRPAVTAASILASGKGQIVRLDLKTYEVATTPLSDAGGLLGNLINVDGKLIASNTLGVCVYDDYDRVRASLTEVIARAGEADRAKPLLRRARLAFDARRYSDAMEDFRASSALADRLEDTAMAAQVQPWLYRTYVAMGNHSPSTEGMIEMFRKAETCADTDQEKAHMKIRLAKCRERLAGEKASKDERLAELHQAIDLAHEVAERFGSEKVFDWPIGKEAGDKTTCTAQEAELTGKDWTYRRFIPRVLEIHGRDVYAEIDARARQALDAARESGDPDAILAVIEKWPNSRWVDEAQFAAVEAGYLRATGLPDEEARKLLRDARGRVSDLAQRTEGPMKLASLVGMAVLSKRFGYSVSRYCDQIRDLCEKDKALSLETSVKFGDIQGTLRDVLRDIEGDNVRPGPPPSAPHDASAIRTPLAEVFRLDGLDAFIIRDQEYNAIRAGEKVLAIRDGKPMMVDAAAGDARSAIVWVGSETMELRTTGSGIGAPGQYLLGGISRDRKAVLAADRKTITAYDAASGRKLWRKTMPEIGVTSFVYMASGDGVFVAADRSGKLVCLDIGTGVLRWEAQLSGGRNNRHSLAGPPRIRGGMVSVVESTARRLLVYDAATGKLRGAWSASARFDGDLTETGLSVRMMDGELVVQDVARRVEPLVKKKYNAATLPTVLGASSSHLLVSPTQGDGAVEIVPFDGGGADTTAVSTANISGRPGVPADAIVQGSVAYVVCTTAVAGVRKSGANRLSQIRDLCIQGIDMPAGKVVWNRLLEKSSQSYFQVLPLTAGLHHLAVTVRVAGGGGGSAVWVLNAGSGEVVHKIQLDAKGANTPEQQVRVRNIGPAVMTDGRLIVETAEGLTIYGSK